MSEAGTVTLRVARKQYQCTERSYHRIMPGDLYFYAACPPWHDMNRGKKWWVIRACLRCADDFGMHTADTRRALSEKQSMKGGAS